MGPQSLWGRTPASRVWKGSVYPSPASSEDQLGPFPQSPPWSACSPHPSTLGSPGWPWRPHTAVLEGPPQPRVLGWGFGCSEAHPQARDASRLVQAPHLYLYSACGALVQELSSGPTLHPKPKPAAVSVPSILSISPNPGSVWTLRSHLHRKPGPGPFLSHWLTQAWPPAQWKQHQRGGRAPTSFSTFFQATATLCCISLTPVSEPCSPLVLIRYNSLSPAEGRGLDPRETARPSSDPCLIS